MINEGKGISNIVKEKIDDIWLLFLSNSYSEHTYTIGNENISIKFNHLNNYYCSISVDKLGRFTINIGIPTNGKENRVKENIAHELTHLMELVGLGTKPYPKYDKIKKSLIEFKPKSKVMDFISDVFYKTLDNEINANVAQTYIYIKCGGRCSKEEGLKRLKEFVNYKFYDDIKRIKLDIILPKLNQSEVTEFNNLLIKHGVKTISSSNMELWINHWFKIFKRKADVYLKNSERILDEVDKDFEKYLEYVNIPHTSDRIIDYNAYVREMREENINKILKRK